MVPEIINMLSMKYIVINCQNHETKFFKNLRDLAKFMSSHCYPISIMKLSRNLQNNDHIVMKHFIIKKLLW